MSDTFTFLDYPQRSVLIYSTGYSRTKNMPFSTTRKTVYKGVDTKLGFDIKNQDRKPVNLLGKTIMVNIMQVRRGELVLQRRAQITEPQSGYCEFSIFGYDLTDLEPGIYQLSAQIYEDDGMARSLYSDLNRAATMEIELVDGAYPKFLNSTLLHFTEDNNTMISQPVASNLQRNDSSTLHTLQIETTNFKGTLTAFGSLEYGSMGNYSPIRFIDGQYWLPLDSTPTSPTIGITGTHQTQGWNWRGSFRWIKVVYTPDTDNTGTVDKILYRS
jgi:hypothetical protein